MDARKNVKVMPGVKRRLDDLKDHLSVKTEGEVIAYLATLYDEMYPKITLPVHKKMMENAKDLNNQGVV